MSKNNVDLFAVECLNKDLLDFTANQIVFLDSDLVSKAEDIAIKGKHALQAAETKIRVTETRKATLYASLPAAQAADSAAASSGNPGGNVVQIEMEIEQCNATIVSLKAIQTQIEEDIIDFVNKKQDEYTQNIKSIESRFIPRGPEVTSALQGYLVTMRAGKEAIASRHPTEPASVSSDYKGDNLADVGPNRNGPAKSTSQSFTLEKDCFNSTEVPSRTDNSLVELATSFADCATFIENATVETLDELKRSNEGAYLNHRKPSGSGSWTDSAGLPVSPDKVSASGSFFWTPDPKHIYGRSPNNLTGQQICEKYNFSSIEYKNGYPVFAPSTVMASFRLPNKLSSSRQKNYSDISQIIIDDGGASTSSEFNELVANFMALCEPGATWFQNKAQVDKFLKINGLTRHELENMEEVQLIPTVVHIMANHDGAVSNATFRDKEVSDFRLISKEMRKQAANQHRLID